MQALHQNIDSIEKRRSNELESQRKTDLGDISGRVDKNATVLTYLENQEHSSRQNAQLHSDLIVQETSNTGKADSNRQLLLINTAGNSEHSRATTSKHHMRRQATK